MSKDIFLPFGLYHDESGDILENIYHRGQKKIWDGNEIFSKFLKEFGEPNLDSNQEESLKNIFSIILWGEYAAWNISSELSYMIDDYGAKMAAVSQAHDEARHFYVIRDYLRLLNYEPKNLPKPVSYVLKEVSRTKSLAKKLLGMQLMIEPIALTIFRFIRKEDIDPLLSHLLEYIEKDEARHVALGIKYLPNLIKNMSKFELMSFLFWQAKLINAEISGLGEMREDIIILGLDPLEVFEYAENKQLECLKLVAEEMGINESFWKPIVRVIQFRKNMAFYPHKEHGILKRITNSFLGY
jgi:ribonucleotide reductase beta subunit family protein with ferritin-like domain